MSPGLSDDDLVWYVSYGSSLQARPVSAATSPGFPVGGRRRNPGCRDRSAPHRDAAVRLVGGLVFAGDSLGVGEGIAFTIPAPTTNWRLGAYRHPVQLADIVARGGAAAGRHSDVMRSDGALRDGRCPPASTARCSSWRDKDGSPMFTITSLKGPSGPQRRRPPYLRTVLRGAGGRHSGWTAEEGAVSPTRAGVLPGWDADSLIGFDWA